MQAMLFDEPAYRPELAQWHTPPKLAAKMATEHADLIRDHLVIEPAAGGGSLVRAALDVGAELVVAVEIDPAWCKRLRERFEREIDEARVMVVEADFLAMVARAGHTWSFDVSLSNPPFDDGLDTRFLEALRPIAPDHVTLTNASALFGRERFDRVWSRSHVRRESKLVQRPRFGGEKPDGGKSAGGMNDVSVTWWGAKRGVVLPTAWWPEVWT
jgi:predicted RNA methylase